MTTHEAHRHGETPGHPDHGPGGPDPAHGRTLRDDESVWDARYAELDRVWSGEPNHALTVEAATLTPARALDVGCGEGADAVWLATRGWTVTALDPSGVALARARAAAEASGVLVDWVHAGLAEADLPAGGFDLVSVFYPALDLETGRSSAWPRSSPPAGRSCSSTTPTSTASGPSSTASTPTCCSRRPASRRASATAGTSSGRSGGRGASAAGPAPTTTTTSSSAPPAPPDPRPPLPTLPRTCVKSPGSPAISHAFAVREER